MITQKYNSVTCVQEACGFRICCVVTWSQANSLPGTDRYGKLFSLPDHNVASLTEQEKFYFPPSETDSGSNMVMCGTTMVPCATHGLYQVQLPVCPVTPVPVWKQSYGMEQVWTTEFHRLFFQYFPHTWSLWPVSGRPVGPWHHFVDSAKVRFCCDDCGHGWTSMKGRVAFWFKLLSNGEGMVVFKLFGQQCENCKGNRYEPAMWYPEEVVKVLVNIYNRVGQVFYGFYQPPIHKARRPGKPRNPHNSDLCQACKDGVCAERR